MISRIVLCNILSLYDSFKLYFNMMHKYWIHSLIEPDDKLTVRGSYYNHALGQVANLFIKVILCIQGHAGMFV